MPFILVSLERPGPSKAASHNTTTYEPAVKTAQTTKQHPEGTPSDLFPFQLPLQYVRDSVPHRIVEGSPPAPESNPCQRCPGCPVSEKVESGGSITALHSVAPVSVLCKTTESRSLVEIAAFRAAISVYRAVLSQHSCSEWPHRVGVLGGPVL